MVIRNRNPRKRDADLLLLQRFRKMPMLRFERNLDVLATTRLDATKPLESLLKHVSKLLSLDRPCREDLHPTAVIQLHPVFHEMVASRPGDRLRLAQ